MSAATLIFGADSPAPRQTLAFSLSLVLHLAFAFVILMSIRREVPAPPLEISIFEGLKGPAASPPPGEKSAEPGPVGPPPEEVKPAEAPKAPPASRVKAVARHHPAPRPLPVERPVEEQRLLAALKKSGPAPATQAFEGVQSGIALREAPSEGASPTGTLGTARSEADVAVGSVVVTGTQMTGSLGAGVGSVALPGPGGRGSGWSSGSGNTGAGGGGRGRGGFSVSGAGAGGAGRSYASIWEWTQRYLAGLRSAYNNELLNDAALRGLIVVRYEILGSGAIGEVTMVSSQLRDPHLEQEVLNQIRGWRYSPEPTGTVVVTWPFSFRPPS